ncbi:MAG: PAS domain-containing protein [Candidatus Binataceae bacterium]|nr:PAS domain-containing protein [Candidatus Binataceae bacterium]
MIALSAAGAFSPWWSAAVIGVALGGGALAAGALNRILVRHAERLNAMAAALADRQLPSHLVPDGGDALSRAERRLLDAADALIAERETLDEGREEFGAILRGMTEAVVVTGLRGQVVMMNGAARGLFGLAPETDYRGRDFVELCRDPRLQEFVGRANASAGEVISGEISIQHPAQRHLEVSAAPIRQAGEIAAARVLVFHDLTRLKSFETVRADFVANLTHELRTPLAAICGYAETLAQGVDDRETERRFLSIIERQSRRLARLIDDLVSLSELERGLAPLKFEPLEPRRVLDEAAELMREQARRNGIALEVRCAEGLPNIPGDRDRIHQVMINLLDNALKYTPRGGTVVAQARSAHAAGVVNGAARPAAEGGAAGVEFAIADTGEGIPAADIPRLTERFYRVDRARSRELGGTGLGLAIVKHIVQLHRGTLRIESRLREGTTVIVGLPAAHLAP